MPLPRPFLRIISTFSTFRPPKTTARILRSLHGTHDPDRISTILSSSHLDPGLIRAAHPVLASSLRRLPAAARSAFLETLKLSSPQITRESFAAGLIALHGKSGSTAAAAAATFDQLPSLGCRRRTGTSFRALLSALVDAGAPAAAETRLRRHPTDITPGVVCYNIVLHGLLVDGAVDAAKGVLDLMKERGLSPNLVTNNTLLDGFYRNERFDLAEAVWVGMGEEKNIRSYNARLRGLVQEGKTRAAVELFDEIDTPDGYSFTALITGHCRDGNLEEARKVFDQMRRKRCRPDRLTFEALIPGACEAGEVDMALALCKECLSRNFRLADGMVQGVVDLLAATTRIEDAKRLVELGWSKLYSEENLKMPLNCQVLLTS